MGIAEGMLIGVVMRPIVADESMMIIRIRV